MAALQDLLRLQVKNYFPNTWPSVGEPSWVLSFFCFARPEGHLLGTNGYSRVLELHALQTFGGYTPTQAILTNDIAFKGLCDTNLRRSHKKVLPFHKIPLHGSAVFSLVTSDYTLKMILF